MEILRDQNVASYFVVPLVDKANRPDYKASPTLAAGDVKVIRHTGGSWNVSNIGTLPTAITGATTQLLVTLTATELNPDDNKYPVIVQFLDAAGDEWDDQTVIIWTRPVASNVKEIDGALTAGNNATLYLKQLNIVNNSGDAVVANSTGGNGDGISASGNGTGHGLNVTAGATGNGIDINGGATSGHGIDIDATGSSDLAINAQAGVKIAGISGQHALDLIGGSPSEYAINANGGARINAAAGGHGLQIDGHTTGHAVLLNAGSTGNGIDINGGSTSGSGINVDATSGDAIKVHTDAGDGVEITSSSGNGINISAGGATFAGIVSTGSGTGNGIEATGGANGNGIKANGGLNSGDGIVAAASDANSNGLTLSGGASGKDIDAKEVDTIDTVVDAIKAVTDNLPNSGALTDIDTGVNNIEAKLPTNYIMGSSVQSDKDDEIDAIKAVTDLLPNGGALTDIDTGIDAIVAMLPSKTYLAGTDNSDGDIELNEATGALPAGAFTNHPDVGISASAIDDIWDEVLTAGTHDVVNSAGRRVRAMQEYGTYDDGAVYLDTNNGTAGTTSYENGTNIRPTASIGDALTIASALNLSRIKVANGSSIILGASLSNFDVYGERYTVDFSGENISGSYIHGASVSGACTGATPPILDGCFVNAVTIPPITIRNSAIASDITLGSAGDIFLDKCYSGIAGSSTPSFDYGAGIGNTNLNVRHYSGGLEVKNMGGSGTDKMSYEGDGQLVINANCSGGDASIRGNFTITDNAGGAVNVSDDARMATDQVDASLVNIGLDHLVSTSVAGADVADDSIVAKLVSKSATADWDTYNNTTDSHEAQADILALVDTGVDAIEAKLPTNYIMGSSVQTDKDDEIDAIKAVTDNLPNSGALTDIDSGVNAIEAKLPDDYIMGSSVQTAKDDEIDDILADTANINSLMPVGTVASQTDVQSIQNNTRFVSSIPATAIIPPAGDLMYKVVGYFYNTVGQMEDPDGLTVDSGTATATLSNKLIETGQNFLTTVKVGDRIDNTTDATSTIVTAVDSDIQLSLADDIMVSGEDYDVVRPEISIQIRAVQGQAYKTALFDDQTGSTAATASTVFTPSYYMMQRVGVGKFETYYKLPSTEDPDQWTADFAMNENSQPLHYTRTMSLYDEQPGTATLADTNTNKDIIAKSLKERDVSGTSAVAGSVYDDIMDNIDANEVKIDAIDTVVDAIKAVTDLLPNGGALTDIDTGVNNIEAKLPTNYIMGSSDQTDKDDEIDAIKAVTDLLPNGGALTDIDTGVNAIEAKLPNNYIMGSSVQTDKDDEIDSIKSTVEGLNDVSSADVQTACDAAITANTTVGNIDTGVNNIEAKLPTNFIMGSSDQTDKDDEIDAIVAQLGSGVDLGDGTSITEMITAIAGKTADAGSYDRTNDSQEAIRDNMGAGGTVDANIVSIDGALTNGNNAILNLKQLNIQSDADLDAVVIAGSGTGHGISVASGVTGGPVTGDAIHIVAVEGHGIYCEGNGIAKFGMYVKGTGIASGAQFESSSFGPGLSCISAGGSGLQCSSSGNGVGASFSGSGTGAGMMINTTATGPGLTINGGAANPGIRVEGGATGNAIEIVGGSTSGNGLDISTTKGYGVNVDAAGADKHGINIESDSSLGVKIVGVQGSVRMESFGGPGLNITSAGAPGLFIGGGGTGVSISAGSGAGVSISGASNSVGVSISGNGTAPAMQLSGSTTGSGLKIVGGSASGHGIEVETTDGDGVHIEAKTGAGNHGIYVEGKDRGIWAQGETNGIYARTFIEAGPPASGAGFKAEGYGGAGIEALGDANHPGLLATGGAGSSGIKAVGTGVGTGLEIIGGASDGKGIHVAATGNGYGVLIESVDYDAIHIESENAKGMHVEGETIGIHAKAKNNGIWAETWAEAAPASGAGFKATGAGGAGAEFIGEGNFPGIQITSGSSGDGININAQSRGIEIGSVAQAIYAVSSASEGMFVQSGSGPALQLNAPSGPGLQIQASSNAINAQSTGSDAIFIRGAGGGINVDQTAGPALILSAQNAPAIDVNVSGGSTPGITVDAPGNGVQITSTGAKGMLIESETIGIHARGKDGGIWAEAYAVPPAPPASGPGFRATGSGGEGILAEGEGTFAGIRTVGGDASGAGILAEGGTSAGTGIDVRGKAGSPGMQIKSYEDGPSGPQGKGLIIQGASEGDAVFISSGANGAKGIHVLSSTDKAVYFKGKTIGLHAEGETNGIYAQSYASAPASGAGFKAEGMGGPGIEALGEGSFAGFYTKGGATGPGIDILGGDTSGNGIRVFTTDGVGINIDVAGSNKEGVKVVSASGPGIHTEGTLGFSAFGSVGAGFITQGQDYGIVGNGPTAGIRAFGFGLTATGFEAVGALNGPAAKFLGGAGGVGNGAGIEILGSGTEVGVKVTTSTDNVDAIQAISTGTGSALGLYSDPAGNDLKAKELGAIDIETGCTDALNAYDSGNGVATQSSVDAIQNNTRFVATIPSYCLIPLAGSNVYKLKVHFYDSTGNMEDPDSNEFSINIETVDGVTKNATLYKEFALSNVLEDSILFSGYKALERESVGSYFCFMEIASTEDENQFVYDFACEEASIALHYSRTNLILESVPEGAVDANIVSIDGELTNGNNATLNLKQLNIANDAGIGLSIVGSVGGINITGDDTGYGIRVEGGSTSGDAVLIDATDGIAIKATGGGTNPGIYAEAGDNGIGVHIVGGSISGDGIRSEAQANDDAGFIMRGDGTGKDIDAAEVGAIDVQDILDMTIDGSATFAIAMKQILSYCGNNINRSGAVYTYRNYDNNADVMTITGSPTGRART